jgi:PPOX class probable F420-dependent enzyme
MPRSDVSMSREEIVAFLEPARVGVLATIGSDGRPHLSAMWFVPVGDELHMWTYSKSQKALNARRDPRATLLVEEGESYNELKGISVSGDVLVTDDFERVRAVGVALYERYTKPRLGTAVEDGPIEAIERQAHKRVALVLSMDKVASWDHSKLA